MARSPSNPQLVLKPQDLVVLLRLALDQGPAPTYAALGSELGITASEIHAAVNPNDANVVLLERAAEHLGNAQHRLPDMPQSRSTLSSNMRQRIRRSASIAQPTIWE
jgi:hypothetical protein